MMKKIVYILLGVGLAGLIIYRIHNYYAEQNLEVFNAARMPAVPVETIVAISRTDVLREPLTVKNNRAWVSSARAAKFSAGQNIGVGKITFVSGAVNLDTGMHLVKTSGVPDGLFFAEHLHHGFFIPIHATRGDSVLVKSGGVAVSKKITVIAYDSENVVVSGLDDGDEVVLSKIDVGAKI